MPWVVADLFNPSPKHLLQWTVNVDCFSYVGNSAFALPMARLCSTPSIMVCSKFAIPIETWQCHPERSAAMVSQLSKSESLFFMEAVRVSLNRELTCPCEANHQQHHYHHVPYHMAQVTMFLHIYWSLVLWVISLECSSVPLLLTVQHTFCPCLSHLSRIFPVDTMRFSVPGWQASILATLLT